MANQSSGWCDVRVWQQPINERDDLPVADLTRNDAAQEAGLAFRLPRGSANRAAPGNDRLSRCGRLDALRRGLLSGWLSLAGATLRRCHGLFEVQQYKRPQRGVDETNDLCGAR